MKIRSALMFSLGVISAPSDAFASSQKSLHTDRVSAETEMANFSKCVVKENRSRVIGYLRLSPTTKEFHRLGQRLASNACLSPQTESLAVNPQLFRWSVFEALYKADFGSRPVGDVISAPPLDFRAERDWLPDDKISYINNYIAFRDFGDCTARSNAPLVASLLATKVYSDEEQAILGKLQPELGRCLAGTGQLSFTRTSLRGILAEALYNLSVKALDATSFGSQLGVNA